MKKVLSLVLAAVLALSVASVAFANNEGANRIVRVGLGNSNPTYVQIEVGAATGAPRIFQVAVAGHTVSVTVPADEVVSNPPVRLGGNTGPTLDLNITYAVTVTRPDGTTFPANVRPGPNGISIPPEGTPNAPNVPSNVNFQNAPFWAIGSVRNPLHADTNRNPADANDAIRFAGNVRPVVVDPAGINDLWVLLNPADFGGATTVSELTRQGYRVSTTRSTGMNTAIHSVQFENHRDTGLVAVRVRFARELVSVTSHDFEFDVRITNPRVAAHLERVFRVEGTFENYIRHIHTRYDDTCTGCGEVIESEDFIGNVTFDAGVGVRIHLNTYRDVRYYARAFMMEIPGTINDHQAIEGIIHINTAASRNATFRSARVDLNTVRTYYVFNEEFQYIGLSTDRGLPFSQRYYLSTDRNWGGAAGGAGVGPDEIPVIDAGPDHNNPVTGGDSTPANVNENPGTGR